MSTVAVIPARGGSQRLPGKNVAPFMGRPLIHWTVKAALESGVADRVIVSTDDPAIAEAAQAAGAEIPFLRPAHLATSTASTLDVVLHLWETAALTAQHYILMQPTSPLRTAQDLAQGFQLFRDRAAPAVVSVTTFDMPWIVLRRTDATGALALTDEPKGGLPTLQLNGAFYIGSLAGLQATRSFTPPGTLPFVMPAARSVDIDTLQDFRLALVMAQDDPQTFGPPA